jgi:asparagine synthase (glutamine-hydrolysing)
MEPVFYGHLNTRSFYHKNDGSLYTSLSSCLKENKNEKRVIDNASVLSILMKNYIIGDRTLVRGISRSPWMSSRYNNGEWQLEKLPFHDSLSDSSENIASELYRRLSNEALKYIGDKKKIGILLSGGMDSRITAGIIRRLQESGEFSGEVVALTWGVINSRDVNYARQISIEFEWEFRHFILSPDVLKRNVILCADQGAEYSPIHLHAMESVSCMTDIDCILAGSYGDSIGRGEYSGRHISDLPPIFKRHLNKFCLLAPSVEQKAMQELNKELLDARRSFPERTEGAYREIEMQMHYMRRQLNSCMDLIDDRVKLFQMFSSPDVFGYMWSLNYNLRTDEIYSKLLKKLPYKLNQIPWARTGKRYGFANDMVVDNLEKNNNCYGKWLRNDLRNFILKTIDNGSLYTLGIFDKKSLKMWCNHWSRSNSPKADRLDEKMAWLASLALFVEKYNIEGEDVEGAWANVRLVGALSKYYFYRLAKEVMDK